MIEYFYGGDSFAAREAIEALAKKRAAQVEWISGEGLNPQTITVRLSQGGNGLFGKKMLVVREASRLPAAVQERLVAPAFAGQAADLVAWDEGAPDRRSLVYRTWKDHAREFAAPSDEQLAAWLVKKAQHKNVQLHNSAAQELVGRLGNERWRLLSELERLSLVHAEITAEIVAREIEARAETGEVFELLSALVRGDKSEAVRQLGALLEAGESEFYVVAMLAYQFRMLYMIARGTTQGLSPGVVRRNTAVARRRSAAAWLENLTRVVATDFAIKQGKTDPRTGVTMLVLTF